MSHFLSGSLSGLSVSTYREGNELVEILLRGPEEERTRLDLLGSLAVPTSNGSVPLSQIADLEYAFEDGIIWHRDRLPTVTVRADLNSDDVTAPTVVAQILPTLEEIRSALPQGYLLETGGTVEDSARGQSSSPRACRCSCWP